MKNLSLNEINVAGGSDWSVEQFFESIASGMVLQAPAPAMMHFFCECINNNISTMPRHDNKRGGHMRVRLEGRKFEIANYNEFLAKERCKEECRKSGMTVKSFWQMQ